MSQQIFKHMENTAPQSFVYRLAKLEIDKAIGSALPLLLEQEETTTTEVLELFGPGPLEVAKIPYAN